MSKVLKTIGQVAGVASLILAPFNPVAAAVAGLISGFAPPAEAALAKPLRRDELTLMNGLIHDRTAFLYTDTGLWDSETWEMIGETTLKAFSGTLWPWAAVHTGQIDLKRGGTVPQALSERYSLSPQKLLADATDVLRIEGEEGRVGRLLIAFADAEYGARMFILANDRLPFTAPFEPFEVIEYKCSGSGEDWAAEFVDRDMSPGDMHRFIELQRNSPFEPIPGVSIAGIAGDVYEIEVGEAGVASRIVSTGKRKAA